MDKPIQTEHGTWSASGGKSTVKTNGVEEPDVYTYQVAVKQSLAEQPLVGSPSLSSPEAAQLAPLANLPRSGYGFLLLRGQRPGTLSPS